MSNVKDLTGTKTGKLTLMARKREKNRTYYFCKCECGTEKWVRADKLSKSKDCGCDRYYYFRDLTGEKLGLLTAIKVVGTSKDNGKIWSCECDCGNYTDTTMSALTSGATISCGCYQSAKAKENIKKAHEKHKDKNLIDNTNIAFLRLDKPIKSNISGVTGVCFNSKEKKWVANIDFKKKRYFLGYFKKKEEAIKARKEAEHHYHKSFLEWYKNKVENEDLKDRYI